MSPPTEATPSAAPGGGLTSEVWEQTVRPALRGMTRAVYAPATFVDAADGTATFSLPNVVHREKCEQHREAVETAIRTATGAAVVVQLLVEGESAPVATSVVGARIDRGPRCERRRPERAVRFVAWRHRVTPGGDCRDARRRSAGRR